MCLSLDLIKGCFLGENSHCGNANTDSKLIEQSFLIGHTAAELEMSRIRNEQNPHQIRLLVAPASLKMMVLGVASNSQGIGSGARTHDPNRA